MLYLAVGTLWVVSIICMIFIAAYIYRLTKQQLLEGNNSYFWTISRVLIVLLLGLSTFYFGVASRIESLPKLVSYQMQIEDIPLWSPEAWVGLSLAFGVCGALFALTDTLRNDFEIQKGLNLQWRSFKLPQLPLKVPYALTVSDVDASLNAPTEYSRKIPARYMSQADQYWALANVLVGLFTGCLLFVGLQTVSQLNFVQALGIERDFNGGIAFNERVRPTATPITGTQELQQEPSSVPVEGSSSQQDIPTNQEDAVALLREEAQTLPQQPVGLSSDAVQEQGSSTSATESAAVAPLVNNNQSVGTNLVTEDSAGLSASEPDAAATADTQTPATQTPAVVSINEPLGVNARSGPSTDFSVITVLQAGTRHPLIALSDDGQWLNIQLPDTSPGWVASWVVELTQ